MNQDLVQKLLDNTLYDNWEMESMASLIEGLCALIPDDELAEFVVGQGFK